MNRLCIAPVLFILIFCVIFSSDPVRLQAQSPSPEDQAQLEKQLHALQKQISELKKNPEIKRELLADVEVYAKAAEWILRHNEFYKPQYVKDTYQILETGRKRAQQLQIGKPEWTQQTGTVIFGYYSKIAG